MPVQQLEQWQTLALHGQWDDLLASIRQFSESGSSLMAALWQVRALRALKRGAEANQVLLESARGRLQAKPEWAIELAEELLQCAYFVELKPLLDALGQAGLPAVHFLRAGFLREHNRWPEALAALSPLQTLPDPWPAIAQQAEGWIYLRRGWLQAASESLAPFAEDRSLATQKLLARLDLACGRIDDAHARLKQVASRQPYDWEWPILLAAVHATQGVAVAECLTLAEQGLVRQPRQAEGLALLVHFKFALGDEEGARQAMAEALAIKPWQDSAVLPLIEKTVAARQYDAAKILIKKFQKLANTPRREAAALDVMRLEGAKVRDVVALADSLSLRYQDDPDVLRSAAAAYQACKRNDPAARLLERVLALNPFDMAARNNLAVLYRDRGDSEDAMTQWRALMSAGDGVARINLAQALTQRGDLAEAAELWQAIAAAEKHSSALVLRGQAELLAAQGELSLAQQFAEKACEQEPGNAQNWLVCASLVAHRQGRKNAIKLLEPIENTVDAPVKIRRVLFDLWRNQIKPDELVRRVRNWRLQEPHEVDYHLLEARALRLTHDWDGTEAALQRAKDCDMNEASSALIRFYLSRGRFGAARRIAEQWVREDSSDIRRWAQMAEVYYLENKPDDALATLENAIKLEPTRLSLIRQKVGLLMSQERYEEASATAQKQWRAKGELTALSLWVDALQRARRLDEAVEVVREALVERPKERALRLRLANQLRRAGREDESTEVLRAVFQDEPGSDTVAKALIRALVRQRKHSEAVAVMERFAEYQPQRLDLHVAIADIALEQGLIAKARDMLQVVRSKTPELLDAWLLAAKVERRDDQEATEKALWLDIAQNFPPERWAAGAMEHWIRLDLEAAFQDQLNRWRDSEPDNPGPWWIAFRTAQKLRRYLAALDIVAGIERRQGETAETYSARAKIYNEQWRMSESIACCKKAHELAPIEPGYLEQLIGMELKAGDWELFDQRFQRLEYLLGEKRYQAYENMFFNLNCHPSWDSATLYSYYQSWDEHVVKPTITVARPLENKPEPERKLKIGYISPDFRQHAVAKFSDPILRAHDREQFEVFAYAYLDDGQADTWTENFKRYVDHWREIRHWSLDELEQAIRDDGIDILVDLAGHTSNHRLAVFKSRPAPITAAHIVGAGQTSGMSCIDYLIATPEIWPETLDTYAAEQVARVEFSGVAYKIPEEALPPAPLPYRSNGYVTFGVFARPVRTHSNTIRVWAEILRQVPGSRLRFEHAPYLEPDIQDRFIRRFAEFDIGADRLEFAYTRPYWAGFHGIDLQLDPFPAGSGTTATEGLYMERLPITVCDRPAMGRGTHAQLTALNLAETCSAASEQDYIAKAVALALNTEQLELLSTGLRERFLKSPLTDYSGYAKALAKTYRQWWHQWCHSHKP